MNQFPFLRPNHPIGPILVKNHDGPFFRLFSRNKHLFETFSRKAVRQFLWYFLFHIQQIQQGFHKIILAAHGIGHSFLRKHIRPGNQKRYFYRCIKKIGRKGSVSLAPDSMVTHIHPVISHEKEQSMFQFSPFFQPVQNLSHAPVHGSHGRIISPQQLFSSLSRPIGRAGDLVRMDRQIRHR